MLVKTYGCALFGIDSITVTVEVNVTQGIKFFLVGLPDNAIKESQQRISSSLEQAGYRIPGKKIIINMAPADIKKEGAAYDLTIAVGILCASKQIVTHLLERCVIMGELSLDGSIKPIKGALPIAIKAKKDGFKAVILPKKNAPEASIVEGIKVYGVEDLKQVIQFLEGKITLTPEVFDYNKFNFFSKNQQKNNDFKDVKGQANIKRALEIAATGNHNVILIGPPGAGKTMLAKRISGILPQLTLEEALETTKIHSVLGIHNPLSGIINQRPFRSPHHTISDVAMVGGGSYPQPGEISLAHNGILFLDELPEFKRTVLEALRQTLEEKKITISRAKFTVNYPADFILVASMNPCPCGYYNHPEKECICAPSVVQKYLNKISGPIMDRIDLHVEVTPLSFLEMHSKKEELPSSHYATNILKARKIQYERQAQEGIKSYTNTYLNNQQIKRYCQLDSKSADLLKGAMEKLNLSARAYNKILKVSRTIADLDNHPKITFNHISEAIQYRSLDKKSWLN